MSQAFLRPFLTIVAAMGLTAMIWIPTLTVAPSIGVSIVSFA